MIFKDAKMKLVAKKQIFEDIGNEYKANSFKKDEFSAAKESFEKALDEYEQTLHQLSIEEYDIEYKEALHFDAFASREYNPFLSTGSLESGQNVTAKPFNPFAVASFRCDLARKWVYIMTRNIH